MAELQTQKEFWTRKVQEAINVLQLQFVKPVNDLTEALQQLFNVQELEKKQLIEKKAAEKKSQ